MFLIITCNTFCIYRSCLSYVCWCICCCFFCCCILFILLLLHLIVLLLMRLIVHLWCFSVSSQTTVAFASSLRYLLMLLSLYLLPLSDVLFDTIQLFMMLSIASDRIHCLIVLPNRYLFLLWKSVWVHFHVMIVSSRLIVLPIHCLFLLDHFELWLMDDSHL